MERLSAVSPPDRPLAVTQPDPQKRPPLVWLVGAHGGAGTTYLAASLAFVGENGNAWPDVSAEDVSPYAVIVARESTSGLDAAETALRQWHTDPALREVTLLGLVLVAETSSKKLGKELQAWRESVSALAPETYRVGWIPDWTNMRPGELPTWWPGDAVPEKKKKYESDVPATIATVGHHLYTAAIADLTEKEESNA